MYGSIYGSFIEFLTYTLKVLQFDYVEVWNLAHSNDSVISLGMSSYIIPDG